MNNPTDETLPGMCRRAARLWPERPAIVCEHGGTTTTFAALDALMRTLAAELVRRGIQPGHRVAVRLPNCVEFPALWLAITTAGAVMVPVNPAYRRSDIEHVLRHSGAQACIGDDEFIAAARALLPTVPTLAWVDGIDSLLRGSLGARDAGLPEVRPDWPANIQFTSGTTGLPKGCVLSHRYWVRFGRCFVEQGPHITAADTLLTAQRFSYADPQWNVALALQSGATLVMLDGFSPSRFWQQVVDHGVTFIYCLGAMPTLMLKMAPGPAERSHRVRMVVCSGIPRARHHELEERFGVPWHEAYGTTETGGDLIVPVEEHAASVGTGHLGRPVPGKELRILDPDGMPVVPGAVGELCLRGVGMMDRYHDDAAATEFAFRGGWYHTGDLVQEDPAGRLCYVARNKDMIRRGGENIAAAEVEAVLQGHDGVRMAACVAVPDELRGEEVKVFVVAQQEPVSEQAYFRELVGFLSDRIADFKVPRYWELLAELPLTVSSKVAKPELLQRETNPPRGWDRSLH